MKMPTSAVFVFLLANLLVLVSSLEGSPSTLSILCHTLTLSGLLNNGSEKAIQSPCSDSDIVIAQSQVHNQPSSIPSFLVQITNTNTKVQISNIHVSCGQFSTTTLIRPDVFKRVAVNDCLVNGGQPLAPGLTLSFTYANSFKYPLAITTIKC